MKKYYYRVVVYYEADERLDAKAAIKNVYQFKNELDESVIREIKESCQEKFDWAKMLEKRG